MSRYLEEAARVLKAAEDHAQGWLGGKDKSQALKSIAEGYADLAAIDKGMLPADLAIEVLRQAAEKGGR
ncbi:hypothetical protein ABZ891_12635 [Streptomyces sp. NPDC047023]|uniref:hypothetical protein n=1 Tax=Streptomyces sp. NPDC047023 TaxID=3155139 RepID=UPI0033EAFB9F